MLATFIEKGLSQQQMQEELMISLYAVCPFKPEPGMLIFVHDRVAGSETTSTAVHATLLSIISDPRVYANLTAEIDRAVASGQISSPIKQAEAIKLPYLQALYP